MLTDQSLEQSRATAEQHGDEVKRDFINEAKFEESIMMLHISQPFKSFSEFTLRDAVLQYGRTFVSPAPNKNICNSYSFFVSQSEESR